MPTSIHDRFAVVISVGPNDRELSRLRDVVAGVMRFERDNIGRIVVVDDSRGRHDYSRLGVDGLERVLRIVPSVRRGRGDGWRGGLTVNVLYGLKTAFLRDDVRFALKLDTDSLVIGPLFDRVRCFFESHPDTGVLGSGFASDFDGSPVPPSTWRRNLRKHARILRLRRKPFPRLECALWGRKRDRRDLLLQAIANGWPLGACAQGGGYAVRRELVEHWLRTGFLADDLLWLDTDLTEDVTVALLCYAARFRVADDNGRGGVFGVQYQGLAMPVPALFEHGYAVVHSVKAADPVEESRLRHEFAAQLARTDCRCGL